MTDRHVRFLFGYAGSFTAGYLDAVGSGLRSGLRPVREEARA